MILTNANIRVSSKQLRFMNRIEKSSFDDVDSSIFRLTKLLK